MEIKTASKHEKWLLELTGLPTAAGCEQQVVRWVRAWARRRKQVVLEHDPAGNLLLYTAHRRRRTAPIFVTAHMDHPAFVVTNRVDRHHLVAEFRGGVPESYFVGSEVVLPDGARGTVKQRIGTAADRRALASWRIGFSRPTDARPGDVLTWDTGRPRIVRGRLQAPACDDLAGVAAALAAFDRLLARHGKGGCDLRLLLTRAEEVGFIGAIAAARSGRIPAKARLIVLENSKTLPDAPLGGGPIVRVGDRTSTFDPDLTYRIGQVAEQLAGKEGSFKWQRRLMTGGTCEASAFGAYGYRAACLCLAVDHYHNANERSGRIDREQISVADFHHLVRLIEAVAIAMDEPAPLRRRLEAHFARHRSLVAGGDR